MRFLSQAARWYRIDKRTDLRCLTELCNEMAERSHILYGTTDHTRLHTEELHLFRPPPHLGTRHMELCLALEASLSLEQLER